QASLLDDCPYGEAPQIESSDGTEPDPAKGNWTIDGEPRDVFHQRCSWIVSTPDACADCVLNPSKKPAPSARLAYILRLQNWQAAGAQFHFNDLRPQDWDDLVSVRAEQQKFERERWRTK